MKAFKDKIKSKIDLNKIFYFCYIFLLMESMFSTVPFLNKILKYIVYTILIFLVFYIILINKDFKKNELLKILIYFTITTITAFVARNKQLLKIMLIIMAFKEIDFEEFIKKDLKYRLIFLIIVILLSFLGLTKGNNIIRENGTFRYSLGFYHPNILGLETLTLCLEYLYINRNKNKPRQFIIVIIALLFNIFITDSRACITSLLLILIYLCFPKKTFKTICDNLICKFLIKNIYFIVMILIFILSFNFKINGNNFINKIDDLLSTRLYCANYYIKKHNVFKPFGQYIKRLDSTNNNFLPLDIRYIHLTLIYGPIMMILLLYMFYIAFKRAYQNQNYSLILILIIWSIYSLIEANALFDVYNPFLVVLSVFFYSHIKSLDNQI